MLSHTVLFRLPRPLDPAQQAEFVAALREFAADAPPTAGPVTITTDLGLRDPDNPRVADSSLSTTFPDVDAFAAYLDHPRHQAIVAEVLEPSGVTWLSMQSETSPT
ncbi:Dabb family protein [Pseudonocardia oroxyli]|uniref:Stress responsive A/B Barrel Domain n=1 Tax=Pseudonocardia oroxyli TaxID=366584 RepID=A0A1G8CNZ1_PSEOR|nr:Dabb family protein [Pseudonocardia oroxyli]SDH46580.1 Stress responsive A/B Barrel Domain [Pseudonocardia oroxyli]